MLDRFTRTERTVLVVALALAGLAGWFVWSNFARAFPEAHLEFAVTRSSSEPIAVEFLKKHAPSAARVAGMARHAAIFRVETQAKLYLERELGLERLGELTESKQVRLWSWSHRYFTPLDKEEVRVDVSPEGEVIGFSHPIAEEAPGDSLEEEKARSLAESFLAEVFGVTPQGLEYIESHREDRPARRDWTFTFERADWHARDATYRSQVEVHGSEVAAYREFLKVPEAWTQSYQHLRSANETTALVAALGIVLTILAAVVVLVRESRRGNVRWRLVLGLSSIAFVLVLLLSLNEIPVALYWFDTTGTFGAFLARQVLGGLGSAGGQSLLILVLVAAAEPLYRRRFPGFLRLDRVFGFGGWRSKRFAFGLALGYCLALLFIAYQVGFYLIGRRFGAWNPADVPFDNLLNTSFPWVAVLFMGFYPAVSEEFMSRVFSIPLLERLGRSRVLAIIVSAAIWGFAHANYPAQPFYIRGVEVAVAGIMIGVIFYRFGAIPCLVWHYVVDAGYTSILLVRSGNPYFVATAIAGTGLLLVPLVVTVVAAWRRGGFVADPELLNAADSPTEAGQDKSVGELGQIPTPPIRRLVLTALVAAAAAASLVAVVHDPVDRIGLRLRPAAVEEAATRFLEERGVDAARYRLVATVPGEVADRETRRYLLENGGPERVADFASSVPLWRVRAFVAEEREEWLLLVDGGRGEVARFVHTIPEEQPGAELDSAAARVLAEGELRNAGLRPESLEFREERLERRPHRLDYEFTWKDPTESPGEAEYLISVTVQGDRVGGHTRRLKLPESWERERQRGTVLQYGLLAIKLALLAALLVQGLITVYRAVRTGALAWRPVLVGTALVTVATAIGLVLQAPLAWAEYVTAWPALTFRVSVLIGLVIAGLLQALLVALVLAVVTATQPSTLAMTRAESRRPAAAAAWLAAATAVAGLAVLSRLEVLLRNAFPTWFPDLPVTLPAAAATAAPALAVVGEGLLQAVMVLGLAAVASQVWSRGKAWHRVGLILAGFFVLLPGGSDASLPELAMGLARSALELALFVSLIRWVLGRNVLAYAVLGVCLGVAAAALPLATQPNPVLAWQGWALIVVTVVATALWSAGKRRHGTSALQG